MNPVELKRQILMDSERLGIRKKIVDLQAAGIGLTDDAVLEIGGYFEGLTQHKGWVHLEAYILRNADPVALLMSGEEDPIRKGEARGLIKLMQYVDQMIKAKNEILAREKAKTNGANETRTSNAV